jgi:anion-transporting  ArsA/GET3 family ATPase
MGRASFDRRFLVVAGKGGVGKSAVAGALGLRAAQAGRRTVIAELNARSAVPALFGVEGSTYEPTQLDENLYTVHVEPDPALHEYALRKLRFEALYKLVFKNDGVRRFLDVIPGMRELLLLGKAFDLEREQRGGQPTWDTVVVEAPATGHGVSLLRLPQVILAVVDKGPMAEEAKRMRALLEDESRTSMVIVTLLEEMPVRETLELYTSATESLHMPMSPLIVNRVWPEDLDPADAAAWLDSEAELASHAQDDEALSLLGTSVRRRAWQLKHLQTLRDAIPGEHILLPELPRGIFDRDCIQALADGIEYGLKPKPPRSP